MNKQEVTDEVKAFKVDERDLFVYQNDQIGPYKNGFEDAKLKAMFAIGKLDEPEKPVVPQFVADWYEEHKYTFEYSVCKLCADFREGKLEGDLHRWFIDNFTTPVETLVKMKLYDYEVEKEKLYTVEIPNPNGGTYLALCKDVDGKLFFDAFFSEEWKTFGKCKLTESEIKEDYDWAWQFAEEVEE